MDSRDIKTNPTITSNFLESIYDLQKCLVDHYVGIEGLPPYPVNVNAKSNQVLLKDFTSRVIEELAEGFEAMVLVARATEANQFWQGQNLYASRYQAMLNHLQNVGEEMADALHFYVELLIYANIQPSDIEAYLVKNQGCNNAGGDRLAFIQAMGKEMLTSEIPNIALRTANGINLLKPIQYDDYMPDGVTTQEELEDYLKYLVCGHILDLARVADYKQALWDITYFLNISRNFLKNKPWKQSEVMTQEAQYQEQLVIGFTLFMGLLEILGCNNQQVYFLYFKKNHINQFRIASKY